MVLFNICNFILTTGVPCLDFIQVDPENLGVEGNLQQIKKTIRGIELKSSDELLFEARKLDQFQKRVLHIAIQFAYTSKERKNFTAKSSTTDGPWRSWEW